MELLRRFALGKDRALVVVTHDERILEFADRIAHLEDGRITKIDDQSARRPEARPKL